MCQLPIFLRQTLVDYMGTAGLLLAHVDVPKMSNNHFHNILILFDALPNFPFTTSETMRDYYL